MYNKLVHAKRQDIDFFECMRRWGVPIIGKYRWCLTQFKQRFFGDMRLTHVTQVMGIRKSDSNRRKNIDIIGVFRATKNVVVHPILTWNKKDVINFIKQHNIEINPCYKRYGHSGNCMFCPYHNRRQIILTLSDPVWREKILVSLKSGKGKISREKYRIWLKLSRQTVLTKTLF